MPIKRISEFPEGSGSLSNDDIFLFMDDPSNGGVTKKIPLSELSSYFGGGEGGNSFGSFYDTTTQTNVSSTGVNTVSYNSTSINSGVSVTSGDRITFSKDGYYNIQFSLQYEKTDSGDDTVDLWLSRTGVYEPWSNTSISVLGNNGKAVAAWNLVVQANSGDYYQLHWHSPDTTMKLLAQTGLIDPIRPDIPSVIITAIEI